MVILGIVRIIPNPMDPVTDPPKSGIQVYPHRVRPARPTDHKQIADIYNHYIREGGFALEERRQTETSVGEWIGRLTEREGLFVLEHKDEVLGWGILKQYSDRTGYRYAGETSTYIRPGFQGHGLGKAIQEHLLALARKWGYHHLTAKILASNIDSIRFHKAFGFQVVGTQHEIGYQEGKWLDVTIMQKILP